MTKKPTTYLNMKHSIIKGSSHINFYMYQMQFKVTVLQNSWSKLFKNVKEKQNKNTTKGWVKGQIHDRILTGSRKHTSPGISY